MPRETQNKILRVLVDQTFQRVGGTNKVEVNVRIITSTARNLEEEIAAGRFREDLYHRLSVVPIRVPPLAERREDVPALVDYFMDQISQATGLPKRRIGTDAMAVLQTHDWPGNVRQLRNNVERLMILAGGEPDAVISADMLPQDVGAMVPSMPRRRRRAVDGHAAARGAGSLRARISARPDQPVRRQHLAHRRIRGDGALGAPSQAQGPGHGLMFRVAYVNGRYRPHGEAMVHIEDRGYQFSDGVYEVCEVRGGLLVDERRHMARLAALARRIADRHADVACGAGRRAARDGAA